MFALELILRDFEAQAFGAVVLASVAANVVGRAAFGSAAFLALPGFRLFSLWEFLLYGGLGVLAAGVGVVFIRVLYGLEDLADRFWKGPEWLRPGIGGLALGFLLLALPEMYGVGYPVLERAIRGDYTVPFLLLLLAGKIFATSLTISIGGSGGVFAPSLFMGAALGSAYGGLMQMLLPGIVGPAGAYGLVGMGAVFAAASRAPITSVLIIFELTGDYEIILPLMLAIALAVPIGHFLSEDTIYTAKLRRRGIDVARTRPVDLMTVLAVRDAMQPIQEVLAQDVPVREAIKRFANDGRDAFPVVDRRGSYRGMVTARRIEQSLAAGDSDPTVGQVAEDGPALTEDQNLEAAVRQLGWTEESGLPVLTPDRQRLAGWLNHRDVLRAYHRHLSGSPRP
jgi:CIC family chloride channel protein